MAKKAIILENDGIQSKSLELMAVKSGFEVVSVCRTGTKAIEEIKEHKPDLLLVDIHLEDNINGIEVIEKTRSIVNSPVIFITGDLTETIVQRAKSIDNSLILFKPISFPQLQNSIQNLME